MPGVGSGTDTQFNIGGGLDISWPIYQFGVGPVWRRAIPDIAQSDGPRPMAGGEFSIAEWAALGTLWLGGRVTIDHLGDGDKQVLELVRHGPNGLVTLSESERSMVSLLLMMKFGIWFNFGQFGWGAAEAGRGAQYADADLAQAPRQRRANWWPVNFYIGAGSSFVRSKIAMTSNQVPGGGMAESASRSKTDTAWSFVLGAQTPVCRNCIFGMPLMAGVEGQWTWLPARTVSITSSTFGFTETGRVSSRSSSRVMFTFSIPFAIGR